MLKQLTLSSVILLLSINAFAQTKGSKQMSANMPDKAYLQKIWDGWSTLNTANVAPFYAKGDHTFYDIAPLKYASWNEYEAGVNKELGDYKSATFTVNDDAQLHPAGDYVWGTATVKSDMMAKSGKRELSQFRWTVIFHKDQGQWLIVHEHVSAPLQ
jgi:ketosteroid isomerase-like protein